MDDKHPLSNLMDIDISTIEKKRAYNETLEQSPEYQRILPEVMNVVYSQYVKEEIERSEHYLTKEDEDDAFASLYKSQRETTVKKLNEAKRLMPDHPEQAAQVFMQLGSCHRLWTMQKNILKEKYGITWYTPDELHPEIIFD